MSKPTLIDMEESKPLVLIAAWDVSEPQAMDRVAKRASVLNTNQQTKER